VAAGQMWPAFAVARGCIQEISSDVKFVV